MRFCFHAPTFPTQRASVFMSALIHCRFAPPGGGYHGSQIPHLWHSRESVGIPPRRVAGARISPVLLVRSKHRCASVLVPPHHLKVSMVPASPLRGVGPRRRNSCSSSAKLPGMPPYCVAPGRILCITHPSRERAAAALWTPWQPPAPANLPLQHMLLLKHGLVRWWNIFRS